MGTARRWRASRGGGGTQRGTTLLELLLVLVILGLVFGVGLGMLTSLDFGGRAAQSLVKSAIRSAQSSSVARSAPARVVVDARRGVLSAQAWRVVGTWHFETPALDGAFGLFGELGGAQLSEDGFVGRALEFSAAGRRGAARISVGSDSSFDFERGFAVDCAVVWDARPGAVWNLGGAIGLEVLDGGALRAWFRPAMDRGGGALSAGGPLAVETVPGTLYPHVWRQVRAQYDRRALRLFVDGALGAELEESAPVWALEGPIVLSDPRAGFAGRIDNLVVSAVDASEEVHLPEGVRIAAGAPAEIAFAPGGTLDGRIHSAPVRLELELEGGRRSSVLVGLYGSVE